MYKDGCQAFCSWLTIPILCAARLIPVLWLCPCVLMNLTFSPMCVGHWGHPWQCPPGLLHYPKEGAWWATSDFIYMFQPAQAPQLQQEKHPTWQAALRYQYEHRLWALLTLLHQDNLHRRAALYSLIPSKRLSLSALEPLTSKGHHSNKTGLLKDPLLLFLSLL